MPPLPDIRVQVNPAFQNTGLDYMGPLYIKDNSNQETRKVWICLFTCLTTRVVHLEVVEDLSAAQFLLCLQRFVARRGKPTRIISDNATQFKLVQSSLQKICQSVLDDPTVISYTSNQGITWKYIVERAPWQGGFYERLVRLVKQCLKKTLGHLRLSLVQLQTVVTEVEAILNSRPLTYVGSDFGSGQVITPAHFLTDCCKWINVTFSNCQQIKGKVYMTFGGHMESNLGNVAHCKYEKESCALANQERLIWMKSNEAQCEYVLWMTMEGHMWNGKFLNKERTFALTWDPPDYKEVKVCSGETATLTDQAIPITYNRWKERTKRQIEPVDPKMQALETHLSEYFNKELANRFLETCRIMEIMQEMDLIFAHHEPTLVARKILDEEMIMARLNGKILDVWPCVPVDSFSVLPMKGESCFNAIPMNFSLKGQTRMGYYDGKTRIIFQTAQPIDCHLMEEMHFTDENGDILLYQGSTGRIAQFNGTVLKHPLYIYNFTIFADFKEVLHKPIAMYN